MNAPLSLTWIEPDSVALSCARVLAALLPGSRAVGLSRQEPASPDSWPPKAVLLVDALTRPARLGPLRRMRLAGFRGPVLLLSGHPAAAHRIASRLLYFGTESLAVWSPHEGLAELLHRVRGLQRLSRELLRLLQAELCTDGEFVTRRVKPCLDRLGESAARSIAQAELDRLVEQALRLTAVCHERATVAGQSASLAAHLMELRDKAAGEVPVSTATRSALAEVFTCWLDVALERGTRLAEDS